VAGEAQRAVADQSGAKERRDVQVGVPVREREAEALVGSGILGKAAVTVVARELRVLAEILEAGPTVAAVAVRPPEPRHADAPSVPNDLRRDHVSEHERELRPRELAVDDVQVGAADGAGLDPEEKLARAGLRLRDLRCAQRLAGRVEEHRAHGRTLDFRRWRRPTTKPSPRSSATTPHRISERS